MENLIVKLKSETKELKLKYLEKVKEFSELKFNSEVLKVSWSEAEWCKFLGITPQVKKAKYYEKDKTEKLVFPIGFYNTKNSKTYRNAKESAQRIKYLGLEGFLKKQIGLAELQYESSIEKLAGRIINKDIDLETITLKTESNMDKGNISTIIKDAKGKSVKAWTILAWGEVNAPHYRYLIK
ncbi:hypothetical protein F132_63 [Flavobacterium sp. phage 1/32]|nr:hypothetical protein F132_63 [Flavobacterium sp. phage 1/32]